VVKAQNQKVTNPTDIGSPLQGRLTRILVKPGDEVKKNQPLFVIEAMKMESIVAAQQPGTVKQVLLKENTTVEQDDWVVEMA
jgi:pyruvate carboxylase